MPERPLTVAESLDWHRPLSHTTPVTIFTAPQSTRPPASIVKTHIPHTWARDIIVLDEGVLETGDGTRSAGTPWVDLAVTDWIAWRQARASLAPFVDNAVTDWLGDAVADGEYAHRLRLWDPSLDVKTAARLQAPSPTKA